MLNGGRYLGLVYRGHNPQWMYTPESGQGAAIHGGRFNPKGRPALYTSEQFTTALKEAQQGFPFKSQPLTLCAYEVDCRPILDLTNARVRNENKIALADLECPWEALNGKKILPPSWRIAESLIQQGIAGIRVQSQAPGATEQDINLVFWKWGGMAPTKVVVIDDFGRLRPSQ